MSLLKIVLLCRDRALDRGTQARSLQCSAEGRSAECYQSLKELSFVRGELVLGLSRAQFNNRGAPLIRLLDGRRKRRARHGQQAPISRINLDVAGIIVDLHPA